MGQSLAKSGPLRALGAMSGTSLDGVDAAVVLTDGITISGFGPSAYHPYSADQRAILAAALGQWHGPAVQAAAQVVQQAHVHALGGFQGGADAPLDLLGFHGQTLTHEPRGRGSLQIGDGAALARALGLPVVWDFRSNDVVAGGEGAPLAPFFHHACARYIGATAPLVFLNLGGVGNLTYVDPAIVDPAQAVLAFDTGPANAPINDLMQARGLGAFDRGGVLAASGRVDGALVDDFLAAPFFAKPPPKSLDRNDFADVSARVFDLETADAAATLTAMAVASVRRGLAHCPAPPSQVLVTGGGRLNGALMAGLAAQLPCQVAAIESVGLDGDMLEAQAFAFLAVRAARGLPLSCPATTRAPRPLCGGRLDWP